jgi:two-component system NtrC family response regulator/two-component system response regulator AtoC
MNRPFALLLVDDDPDLLKVFIRRFTRRGYAVTTAEHPQEAEEAVRYSEYHVAVIDRTLPGQDGVELSRCLRRIHSDLQVILLTGQGVADPASEAERLGVFAYLTKPCRLDELEDVTRRACLNFGTPAA